ncbi:MAG: TIGR03364 family FAD-dependent oxidoreductase [Planctomycetaceae bacterium]
MITRSYSYDVGIIGAGIAGLAFAWAALRRGLRVVVLERDDRSDGASVRNFGMIWPMGQPPGPGLKTALRSRELWLELAEASGLWLKQCGSLHLAHRDDEWAVLQEFNTTAAADGYQVQVLTPEEVLTNAPAANPQELRGGLWSRMEMGVNPRTALAKFANWLAEQQECTICFGQSVIKAETGRITTEQGDVIDADRIIICSGSDTRTLFPEVFNRSELRLCKLQMLRTPPQPDGWILGPHLASGLTLRHYPVFQSCLSFPALKNRIAEETPELDRYGIHILAAQNDRGEIILGDSHEYDAAIKPEDKAEIDELILGKARKMIRLPDWTIAHRWHGLYVKHPTQPVLDIEPMDGVRLVTGFGGAGMTLALGYADLNWKS